MTYITRADLNRKWGARNILAWAKRDGTMTAAQVGENIDAAIESAEAEVAEAFIGSVYALPFVETATGALRPLKEAMIDLAVAQLVPKDEDNALVDADGQTPAQRAHKVINAYLSGTRTLNCTRNTNIAGYIVPTTIEEDTTGASCSCP